MSEQDHPLPTPQQVRREYADELRRIDLERGFRSGFLRAMAVAEAGGAFQDMSTAEYARLLGLIDVEADRFMEG